MIDNKVFAKMFLWMFIGLIITFGVGYYISLKPIFLANMFGNPLVLFGLIIAELVVVIVLSARIRKLSSMTAKILFLLYSLLTGLTFSTIFVTYKISSIIYVFGIAAVLFLIVGLFGYFTKKDLSKLSTFLFMGLLGLIICGILNIFLRNSGFDLGLNIIGIVLFLGYTAYDINIVKRNLYDIDNEDNLAIFGALTLYLDFINIFIRLLRLFGNSSK